MAVGRAVLNFSISKGSVWGSTTPICFHHLPAVSGGGGGSTQPNSVDRGVMNNPDETDRVTVEGRRHVHGGPLPVHDYFIRNPIKHHPKLGYCAQLVPSKEGSMLGRSDFFFHGRGPHGSDGCIVMINPSDLVKLMKALTASNGGILHVKR